MRLHLLACKFHRVLFDELGRGLGRGRAGRLAKGHKREMRGEMVVTPFQRDRGLKRKPADFPCLISGPSLPASRSPLDFPGCSSLEVDKIITGLAERIIALPSNTGR